ncbi:uncharacterized protein [Dermacentor albipictus]|uniref:uncharacterized protein isoform X4 n=1 Tax=Dermacentor albipictus TaxID=60249 RepID=UPI0031FCDF9F
MAKESSDSDHDDDVYFSRQLPIIDPDMLQDVLCILAKQNDEAVREPEEYLDHLSPSNTVELLFQTCAKLELPICVQITAVEYLDRFLVQHVRDLRKQLGLPSACAAVSWDSVVGRMREQVMLRMLSCIQIASKMFSSVKPPLESCRSVRNVLAPSSESRLENASTCCTRMSTRRERPHRIRLVVAYAGRSATRGGTCPRLRPCARKSDRRPEATARPPARRSGSWRSPSRPGTTVDPATCRPARGIAARASVRSAREAGVHRPSSSEWQSTPGSSPQRHSSRLLASS